MKDYLNSEGQFFFKFFIPITPVAKGRPRMGRGGRVFTPSKTRTFETQIKTFLRSKYTSEPLIDALHVILIFNFKRPKSSKRKFPSVRPDLDNLAKGVADAANGVLWLDDAQIVSMACRKAYSDVEGIHIGVTRPEY